MKNIDKMEKLSALSDEEFTRQVGVSRGLFQKMLAVLLPALEKLHKNGGQPPKMTCVTKLLIALQYWREYRTMAHISVDFGCSKSSVYRSIIWIEETLADDGRFSLPGKKALREDVKITVAIDVTEHPVQRPKDEKEQKKHYSGKKKTYH